MDFSLLAARWQIGRIRSDHVPNLVTEMLSEGFDSPAVIALAILHEPSDADLAPYMEAAIAEIGLPPITDSSAAWRVAYATAEDIVLGKISPPDGARTLWSLCTDLDMPDPLRYFVYLGADYDEDPSDTEWFDARIREHAARLIEIMPPDRMSAPPSAA